MINPQTFYKSLIRNRFSFFVGVPDSLLKSFCSCIETEAPKQNHVIAANEGNAIGIASGYHMATKNIPVVYMQNSGLGNCINPLISLTHQEVYCIPMLLIIGWRGAPGSPDEPQHMVQGRATIEQLEMIDISFFIIDSSSDENLVIEKCLKKIEQNNAPVAILVRENSFSKYQHLAINENLLGFSREQALHEIVALAPKSSAFISTTGKCSRELSEIRRSRGDEQSDFLTVGSMGHVSSIALGVAIGAPSKMVICLDGDGSMLMHLGALSIIGSNGPKKFLHIILNNGTHESVGGQPTVGREIDFKALASALNYKNFFEICSANDLKKKWEDIFESVGPTMLMLKIDSVSRADLKRPEVSPKTNKNNFMHTITHE